VQQNTKDGTKITKNTQTHNHFNSHSAGKFYQLLKHWRKIMKPMATLFLE